MSGCLLYNLVVKNSNFSFLILTFLYGCEFSESHHNHCVNSAMSKCPTSHFETVLLSSPHYSEVRRDRPQGEVICGYHAHCEGNTFGREKCMSHLPGAVPGFWMLKRRSRAHWHEWSAVSQQYSFTIHTHPSLLRRIKEIRLDLESISQTE